MGCLQGKEKEAEEAVVTELPESKPKQVDPRLPFDTYRQLFNLRNSWKTVARNLTETSKDCLIRYLKKYPEHKAMYRGCANLEDEEAMRASTSFENAAVPVFNLFDDVMENSENVDIAIAQIGMGATPHKKIKGFRTDYLKAMEEPFIEAVSVTLGDRFTDPTEQNFRKLYQFVIQEMIKALGGETPPEEPQVEADKESLPTDQEDVQIKL
ncbi:hypothetical protein CAPTEDRAFT_214116 [Capitella teleta]|uniref:Globin domain-containing protein n=1 Tax=Capitella teleta TaxID=283909 RepID=R7TKA2_CAPTE|nr:hypothetical protein CAPTEDRAFT_214116 [Capitella teleta]|eukprot:ELT94139.1 hypothetical protein CAPTEDRAFT_214116 [Capitella teleta]